MYTIITDLALDFIFKQCKMTDCKDMHNIISNNSDFEKIYNNKATTKIKLDSNRNSALDHFAFFDDKASWMLFRLSGGALHYFSIQKENISEGNFFRIFQAYDECYSLGQWLGISPGYASEAQEKFGNGKWLGQTEMQEFLVNLDEIIKNKNKKAYKNNFDADETLSEPVEVGFYIFEKIPTCEYKIKIITLNENNDSAVDDNQPAPINKKRFCL